MQQSAPVLRIVLALAVGFLFAGSAACKGRDPTPVTDLGPTDAGPLDGGPVDAGPVDAGPVDIGVDAPMEPAPLFRNPVALPDAELAMAALRILGAPEAGATAPSCTECHSVTRARIRQWRALSDTAMANCLTDLDVASSASAAAMLACLRGTTTSYSATRLGIWSTAAELPWFEYVFDASTANPEWRLQYDVFAATAGMPPTATPFTQAEFDIVAEWFIRGVPDVDTVLPIGAAPTECLPFVSPAVGAHVAEMATTGWTARNAGAGMLSYGCAGATTAVDCLASHPLAAATSFGTGWDTISDGVPGARLRVLFTTDYDTAYWTRSSADGRFVSHGAALAPNLRFIDLQDGRVFGGNASYDTAFFPDGSGFAVQGGGRGARLCESRVLTTGTPTMLTFNEPGCTSGGGIGLYEHLGTSLAGGDYWALAGTATFDNGGHSPTRRDPLADFPVGANSTITRLVNTGAGFVLGGEDVLAHPYEGDAVMSPSFRTLATRQSGGSTQMGFVLRQLEVSGTGSAFSITAPEIGRYCINGGKPEFSYDERWLTFQHYVGDADAVGLGFTGPTDPGFAEYRTRGAANVYLVDLTTGAEYRITNMGPGQYALFPYFRSDGWMYFMVREEGTVPEHVVASDAALVAAAL